MEMREPQSHRPKLPQTAMGILRIIAPVLVYLLIGQAVSSLGVLGLSIWYRVRPDFQGQDYYGAALEAYTRNALVFSMVWAVVSCLLLYKWHDKKKGAGGKVLPVSPSMTGLWKYWVILGVSGCIVGNYVVTSMFGFLAEGYEETARILYTPPLLWQLAAMAAVIPWAEELVFRGLVYGNCRDCLDVRAAAVVSSFLFAWFHGNLYQGIYAFLLGLLLAWIYERGGSLLAPVLAHGSANFISVLISQAGPDSWMSRRLAAVFLPAAAVGMGFWCFWKLAEKEKNH